MILSALTPKTNITIPSYATAFGCNNFRFFDDFNDLRTIDIANTKTNGKNWYLCNFNHWRGVVPGYSPAQPSWFTSSDSTLTINNANAVNNGFELMTRCYSDTTHSWSGNGYQILGSKPFYIEFDAAFTPTSSDFAVGSWLQDQTLIADMIENRSGAYRASEIDIYECLTTGAVQLSGWDWSPPGTANAQSTVNVGIIDNNFHKWGVLLVPRAFNGGTGFMRWYLDRVQIRADLTWTSLAQNYACAETSIFNIMIENCANHNHLIRSCFVAAP